MPIALEQHTERMEQAAAKAARWVVRHQRPDGMLASQTDVVESVYKGMWALTLTGNTSAANRVANWLKLRLTSDGDLPALREEPMFLDGHYLYANGYCVIGSQCLGRFDIATPMTNFIVSRQDANTGGMLSRGPAVQGVHERSDTVSTSIGLLAALFAGNLQVAERCASFLGDLFAGQPTPETHFLSTMNAEGTLLKEGLPEETHSVIDILNPQQDWYFIGLPSLVLSYLYLATKKKAHLDLACAYLDYLDQRCDQGAFRDFSSGKSGVAAALLYRITGTERYRDLALGVADFILGMQTPWGFWCETQRSDEAPPTEISWSDMDMTLEYILWMKLMAMHLESDTPPAMR